MKAGYKRASSKLLAAVLALLMVFGNVASPVSGAFSVYATDENAVVNAEAETLSEEAADEASAEEQASEEDQQDQEATDQAAGSEEQTAENADADAENSDAENAGTKNESLLLTNNANSYSWANLKEAIENGTDAEIVLPGNIAAEGTIVVSRNVKISGATIYANANDTMFKVENNGNLTLGEGLTLSGKKANCEQGCDDGDCNIVKGSEFTGTIDDHKGFFVQVENGGALNIEGAILRDFITDGSVKYAAPVVVNGGKFNMNSGEITHNSVGYTANNRKSGIHADDNQGGEFIGRDKADGSHGSSGLLSSWDKTETAGAVILTGGATASLNGSSKLNGNRADTGAIVVQGAPDDKEKTEVYSGTPSTLNINDDVQINNNVGIHHAGAVFIFNGGQVIMNSGEMSDNFSWNKGGAVWASEEAYGSSDFRIIRGHRTPAGDATFIMRGGKLTRNLAVNRGGAIEVMSNHVALLGGEITGNACRVLGGAIYVEGDGPDRMYTMYIPEGNITGNQAVNPSNHSNEMMYRVLPPASNLCEFSNKYDIATSGDVSDNNTGQYGSYYGHGGGIWLCPFGGNITINLTDKNKVFIGDNSVAEVNNSWTNDPTGKDLLVRPFKTGQGNGINLEESGEYNEFVDETTNNTLQNGNFYAGPIGVSNQKHEKVSGGVLISGNIAANGGGIASNGAIIFGKANPKYVADLSFEVGKRWSENIPEEERKPVEIDLYLIDSEGKRVEKLKKINENGSIGETGTITLDGQNSTHAVRIPLPYNVENKPFKFATLTIEGDPEDKDMTNPAHLADIYEALEQNKKISVKEWFVEIEEKIDGKVTEYKLPADGATIDSIDPVVNGVEIEEAGIHFSTRTLNINVGEVIGNDSEPEIEKYVNEAVHQDIELNQVFDYDVLAYVTMDADKVTIMDDLVSDLEFVSKAEDVTVIDLGEVNNHQVNNKINGEATGNDGTVGTEATDENKVAHKTTIKGNNLTVILDDEATVKALRGHWVKVGFQAQIKKEYQDKILKGEMKLSDLKDANVSKNDPVISDEGHDGIDNTARYTIEVDNEGKYNDESNIVTVKPETVELKVKKTWTNTENNSWPAGTTVTFGIYRHKDNKEEKIDEITLDSSKTSASITLPKLEGVKYSAREIKVTKNGIDSKIDESKNFVIGAISYIANIIKDLFAGDADGEHETGNEIKVDVEISKVKLGGGELAGAEIEVYDSTGKVVEKWKSGDAPHTFKLAPGTYTFKEIAAPKGYQVVETAIKFTVDADGKVELKDVESSAKESVKQLEDGTIVLTDKPEKGGEVEKYVNNKVHEEIVNFDAEFEYEVMAYVPLGATKATIEDTLKEGLVLAGNDGKGDVKLVYLDGDYDSNDHKVNGAVSNAATVEFKNGSPKVDAGNGKISVEISDGNGLRQVWGKWVKMTFKAKVDPDFHDELLERLNSKYKSGDISWQQIKDNKTVQNGTPEDKNFADHQGVDNNAQYKVEFGNDFKSDHETNTVTVKPETKEIKGKKVWDDADNQDGKRPESITVNLLLDGKKIDSRTVTASDNWEWSFTDLAKYKDKKYSIEEINVDGYTSEITGSESDGFTVTNKYTPEKTSVSGKKTWDDADNQDGKRPESITVRLFNGSKQVAEKVVTEKDGWKWTFDNLDKYENGKEIVYTTTEDAVADYSTVVDGNDITNSYTPGKVSVNVRKAWEDSNNQDGKRPASISVTLYADGAATEQKAVLNEGNNWSASFTDLDEMKAGKKIAYTVKEDKVDGYTSVVSGDVENGFVVTNSYTPETTKVEGSKTWDDADNQDGKRPEKIKVTLYANGEEKDSTVVTGPEWKYAFENLPVYEAGKKITYTVGEEAVEGYEAEVTGFDIKNTHTPETTKVEGSKTWDDADNQDGKRPEKIKVTLYANGEEKNSTEVTGPEWKYAFEDLPVYEAGEKITYTVDEEAVEGYEAEVTGFDIKNTHTPETTKVEGSKTWDDADDQDGKRPESITINLLADNEKVDSVTVTADANGDWNYEFKDLPKYKEGKEIVYTVTEEVVADYTTEVEGYNVTNSYTPGKTQVNVAKVWNDSDNQDGLRPDSVTVRLLADGEGTGKTAELNDGNNWSASFTDLDEMKKGKKIDYTIEELSVSGYDVAITGNAADGFTVTNTHEPEKTQVEGKKTWNDGGDESRRPASITVKLLADGVPVDSKTVTTEDGWAWKFENLDKFANGKEIKYTVTEDAVDHYAAEINGTDVVNTYTVPEKYVNKEVTWDFDNFDQELEYDVMAYVTKDGVSLTITDELVPALRFVGENGGAKVYDMGEGYDANDHEENGTVAKEGKEITEASVSTSGQILTAEIADAKSYRDHWIKLTFKAQIRPDAYERVKALINSRNDGDEWANVEDNGLIATRPAHNNHDGVPNKATYSLKTENNGTFKEDTNTVTVEPKTTKIKVKKTWGLLGLGSWPKDTTVTFGLFAGDEELKGTVDENGVFTADDSDDAKQATVVLTTEKHDPVTVTGLPKLDGVKYSAREITVANAAASANVAYNSDFSAGTAIIKDAIKYIVTMAEDVFGEGDDAADEFTANNVLKVKTLISKTDLGGEELEGAKIVVTGKDSAGNEVKEEWTSEAEAHELTLEPGTYTMEETVAPAGYQQITTKIEFEVKEDGTVVVKTTEVNNGGKVEVKDGNHIVLEDAPEKPAIEKYVNKKYEDLTKEDRDGTVHTDLSAFDEVYTYDIQAYITADATVVEVTDELKSVLEFVGDAPTAVVVKDGEGASGATAPKLTKAGEAVEDYSIDAEAWANGKLVLSMGSDAEDAPKIYPNGKWLQITFDAKIKDAYKSLEAIKGADGVWAEITVNEEIDDADVAEAFSGAEVDAHEGIVNDSSYRIKSKVAALNVNVDNEWAYGVKSNTVTVVPPTTEVSFSKTDLEGKELPGAEMVLTDAEGNVIDKWTSTTENHILNLADGEYIMTEKAAPEGYYCVTTEMHFEVKDGEVTLKTTVVDNDGEIEVLAGTHIILKDAPKVQSEYEEKKDEGDEGEEEVVEKKVPEKSQVKKAYSARVNTGDDSTLYIWAVMLMISLIAIAVTINRRRRTN